MPKKAKKGKKAKAPAFFTGDEDLAPFGLGVGDLVRTPLGLMATVKGVKKEVSGFVIYIRPSHLSSHGYRRHLARLGEGLSQGLDASVRCLASEDGQLNIEAMAAGQKMYEDVEKKDCGKLWVCYASGLEAPLEPRQGNGTLAAMGYRRGSQADHITREIENYRAEMKRLDEERRKAQEDARLRAMGIEPSGGKTKKGDGGKKKKKKKKK